MTSIISKIGDNLAVLIPLDLAEQLQLEEGTDISITISEGKLIVTPKKKKSYTLDELLEGMTPELFHPEIDTGIPVGREVW